MNALVAELERTKTRLRARKFHECWNYYSLMEYLEQLAGLFSQAKTEHYRELTARFHDCAGRFPYISDQDVGALVLEVAASKSIDKDVRTFLLTEALFRAMWCAQSSTAGGEGLARSQHVDRLKGSLAMLG